MRTIEPTKQAPPDSLETFVKNCRATYRCILNAPRYTSAVVALADQRDEAMQALKMLCDHQYAYMGADADTANDHGLSAKVKTAREVLKRLQTVPYEPA